MCLCGCVLWLCVVDVSLWCGCVFVIVSFIQLCLWLCVCVVCCGCVCCGCALWLCVVDVPLWSCVCDCVFLNSCVSGCVVVVVCCGCVLWVCFCGCVLWLCVADMSLWLCVCDVCDCVFVVVFAVLCLRFCVCGCVLWLCLCGCVLWLRAVVVRCRCVLWVCLCGCVFAIVSLSLVVCLWLCVVVEVRRWTMPSEAGGWAPAGNTAVGSWRSGGKHCHPTLAVEEARRRRRRRAGSEAASIKI